MNRNDFDKLPYKMKRLMGIESLMGQLDKAAYLITYVFNASDSSATSNNPDTNFQIWS